MYAFDYHRASSVADASDQLNSAEDGKLLAGGMTLIPTLKQRLASPTVLIDLGDLDDLRGIQVADQELLIRAMTTHATVAASPEVQSAIPAIATLAEGIGDQQVRNRGTIGGSIANNDPAADYPAGCLGLGATIVTNEREIAADEFFVDLFETALAPGEVITAVRFPLPERAAYIKFANPASRYATVGVFVSKGPKGCRVAVTGAGQSGVFRVSEMEKALEADFSPDALAGITVSPAGLNSDFHADAEYRAHLIGVLAKRAVVACR